MKTRILFAALGALLLWPCLASAQTILQPGGATTTHPATNTITSGGTFQQVFAAASAGSPRKGCTVQNNGANAMYVYAGAIGSATDAAGVKLAAGDIFYCAINGGNTVILDQISIDGTTGDTFYAGSQ